MERKVEKLTSEAEEKNRLKEKFKKPYRMKRGNNEKRKEKDMNDKEKRGSYEVVWYHECR